MAIKHTYRFCSWRSSNAMWSPIPRYGKYMAVALSTALLVFAQAAFAGLQDENLLQPLPKDFKIAHRDGNHSMSLTEMVSKDETVDDWSTMVTTQIYYGAKDASFDIYRADMEKRWKAACDTAESAPVKEGKENGYAFRLWLQACHFNDGKRPPEITWFKMLKGNDSAYVVQVAFHHEPSKEEITQWMTYLGRVMICDSRQKGQECPKETNQ